MGMRRKYTVTSPPQTMPVLWALPSRRSRNSRSLLHVPSASSSWAMAMDCPSTAPPPMVPASRPSRPTSIWLPLPRGAEPSSQMMVASTASRPFSRWYTSV